jgi:hypothetical protein
MAMRRPRRRGTTGTVGPTTYAGLPGGSPVQTGGLTTQVGAMTGGLPGGTSTPLGGTASPHAPSVIPPDPTLEQARISGQRNVSLSDARALYDTSRINQDFGLLGDGTADPNNPYSKASMLEESYKRSKRGSHNSYAAQGQLYSGALQNAQDENFRNYDVGRDQLQKQFADSLANVKLNQLGTYANAGTGIDNETFNALLRALGGK